METSTPQHWKLPLNRGNFHTWCGSFVETSAKLPLAAVGAKASAVPRTGNSQLGQCLGTGNSPLGAPARKASASSLRASLGVVWPGFFDGNLHRQTSRESGLVKVFREDPGRQTSQEKFAGHFS